MLCSAKKAQHSALRLCIDLDRDDVVMAVKLVKGGNVSLTQLAPDTNEFNVVLGWRLRRELRLDAFCFMLAADGKVCSDQYAVYYAHLLSDDSAVWYLGTTSVSTTAVSLTAQSFRVGLSDISSDVTRLVFAVGIYDQLGSTEVYNFTQVASCNVFVADTSCNHLVSFELSDTMPAYKAMILGELYRYKGQWKFRALGDGFNDGVSAMFATYGADLLITEVADTVREFGLTAPAFAAVHKDSSSSVVDEDESANAASSNRRKSSVSHQAAPRPVLSPATSVDSVAHQDDRASLSAASTSKSPSSDHSLYGGLSIVYLFLRRLIVFCVFVLLLLSPIILIVWLV